MALLIFPYNLNAQKREAYTIIASLQARGTRTDSQICRIEIAWDGKWDDSDSEMKRHLVIRQLADIAA